MTGDITSSRIADITSGWTIDMGTIAITTMMGIGIMTGTAIGMDGAIEANLGCAEVS